MTPADLRQHFHNYFELLLGAELSRLKQSIASANLPAERQEVLIEIDCRVNYLRGAVRMGKLLCLIDQEEAKANHEVLSSERNRLKGEATQCGAIAPSNAVQSTSSRIASIRKSLQPTP
jgi:hypothetical protein